MLEFEENLLLQEIQELYSITGSLGHLCKISGKSVMPFLSPLSVRIDSYLEQILLRVDHFLERVLSPSEAKRTKQMLFPLYKTGWNTWRCTQTLQTCMLK